ncbi:MAG: hypothetical protein KJ601_08025, partial [Nanoarchaeota archaeon]|nr:hypothetical protein [Nanoarchaeota archaeon]
LSYFPIVLGAIWFGVKGGLILALLSSIAFIPHILLYVGQGTQAYLAEMMEKGFVKDIIDKKGRKYITLTDKGFEYLEKYKTILGFIDEFDL